VGLWILCEHFVRAALVLEFGDGKGFLE
jgi:hypothetical protein